MSEIKKLDVEIELMRLTINTNKKTDIDNLVKKVTNLYDLISLLTKAVRLRDKLIYKHDIL